MRRAALLAAVLAIAALSLLRAAGTTVKSGVVDSVSMANNSITVKFSRSDKSTVVKLATEASVRLDGKASRLEEIKPGMSVSVQIGSDEQAERILARTVKDASKMSAAKKTARSKLPPAAKFPSSSKLPPAAKFSKTTGKSSKKKKLGKSALDDLPVATTPFSQMKDSATGAAAKSQGGAWPSFLGPNRDNMSQERGLLPSWPKSGPALAWRTPGLGQGFSTVSISDGIVFSMGTPDSEESVLAIDLETGKPLWSVPTGGAVFNESQGNGPRSTPTIDGGRAYALGALGDLVCIDIKTKKLRWHKNLMQDFGAPGLKWGFSESVLIDGNRLICTPGGPTATILALDKESGETVLWKSVLPTSPQATYASPIAATIGNTRTYIQFLSQGVVGVSANDGHLLWANQAAINPNAICTTPLFVKDHVFVSSGYGAGCALIQLTPGDQSIQARLVYQSPLMSNHHGGLVALNGYVYGASGEVLTCFSLDKGEIAWQNRSVGKCSLTYADGHLYVRSERGPVALVEATPEEYREKGRFLPPTNGNFPTWAYPVVAAGRLFLRDQDNLLCYSLHAGK